MAEFVKTSRDRPKSAPHPRLKNSKKTSKCQVFSFTVLENRKFFEKKGPSGALKSHNAEKLKGGPLRFFNIHSVAKHEKIEENKNFYFRKKSHSAEKKLKGGDPLGFSNIHSVAKPKKLKGGPFGEKISGKKVSQCRKKLEGGTLWFPRVWYGTRENRKILFGSVR